MNISRRVIFVMLAGLLAAIFVSSLFPVTSHEIPYSQLVTLVDGGKVGAVTLEGRKVTADLVSPQPVGPNNTKLSQVITRVPDFGKVTLVQHLEDQKIPIDVHRPSQGMAWLWFLLPWLLILGVYAAFWMRIQRQMGGGHGGGGFMGLMKSRGKKITAEQSHTRFSDMAGQENAKREISELVDFLRDPRRFHRRGADVPHGILLIGPPGTGKTLAARALAGEAGVPFFHMSASEFIEAVVGVGAARVRSTFAEAKKVQPSILFIDEIDAIGRMRGTGLGGGHDEREQTLNQILSEMDGFGGHESVIVVAATNRADVLDPALLRPGRFDRHITMDLPDRKARREILEIHTRNVPLADDVDLDLVARGTPGFSGADLKNLANEAAVLATRADAESVTPGHFEEARDKLIMGAVRNLTITEAERRRLAIHESGHTTVAHFLPTADPIYKVTVIPRGPALGVTHQLPDEERYTLPEDFLKDRIAIMLAGRAAEKVVLGSVSSGADDDIKQATRLARNMVARWGMDDEIGPIDLRQDGSTPFLGREMASGRQFSDDTAHSVDLAVRRLLEEAQERAQTVIVENRTGFERLVETLIDEETLEFDAIARCLDTTADERRRPRVAASGRR